MTVRRRTRNIVDESQRFYACYLAEDYDGISQYVLVSMSRASISGALRARVSAGDVGSAVPALRGTQVAVFSYRGQLEVLSLGSQPTGARPVVGSITPYVPEEEEEEEPTPGITDTFTDRFEIDGWGDSEAGIPWVITSVGTVHASVVSGTATMEASSPLGYFSTQAEFDVPDAARPAFDGKWEMFFNHDLHVAEIGPNGGGESEYFFLEIGGAYIEFGKDSVLGNYVIIDAERPAGPGDPWTTLGTHGVAYNSPFLVRARIVGSTLQIKIWQADDAEPLAWTVTQSMSDPDTLDFFIDGFSDFVLCIRQQAWDDAPETLLVTVDNVDFVGVPAL